MRPGSHGDGKLKSEEAEEWQIKIPYLIVHSLLAVHQAPAPLVTGLIELPQALLVGVIVALATQLA